MFLTIEIRGAAQTVRHRNGEEVSDPVLEFEGEGYEPARPVIMARLDMQRIDKDGYNHDHLEGIFDKQVQPFQDLRVVGSSSGTHTGDSSDEEAPRPPPAKAPTPRDSELLRLARERPRRFLRRLYAEAARTGHFGVRFLFPLDSGRAVLEFSVERGHLTVAARLEVARALGGALSAKAQRMKGLAGFEVELEGTLRPNGDVDDITGDGRARGLDLERRERRMIGRLATVVRRIADQGRDLGPRRRRLVRILREWLGEHPIWAVALLEQLFTELEALPLHPSVRQLRADRRRDLGGPTFDEIMGGDTEEPGTAELTLDAPPPPSLTWLDDRRYQLRTADPRRTARAAAELDRLVCLVPVLFESLDG